MIISLAAFRAARERQAAEVERVAAAKAFIAAECKREAEALGLDWRLPTVELWHWIATIYRGFCRRRLKPGEPIETLLTEAGAERHREIHAEWKRLVN